jgi:hypothetical protein
MRSKNISYLDSIGVDGWLYNRSRTFPAWPSSRKSGIFHARYEDVTADPAAFLKRAGDYLGVAYSARQASSAATEDEVLQTMLTIG